VSVYWEKYRWRLHKNNIILFRNQSPFFNLNFQPLSNLQTTGPGTPYPSGCPCSTNFQTEMLLLDISTKVKMFTSYLMSLARSAWKVGLSYHQKAISAVSRSRGHHTALLFIQNPHIKIHGCQIFGAGRVATSSMHNNGPFMILVLIYSAKVHTLYQ